MVHIAKSQPVPQNENLVVISPSGNYGDNDLVECCDIKNPSLSICAFQAQFIKYGAMVYQYSNAEELAEAILAVDPISEHSAVDFYKQTQALKQAALSVDNKGSLALSQNALIISDGTSCLSDYDISSYATDPLHKQKIASILNSMPSIGSASDVDIYIQNKAIISPLTGEMFVNAAREYNIDCRLLMAIIELESQFGTAGVAVVTLNPGNVGNTGTATRTYSSWSAGVAAVADWLNKHRVSVIIPVETPVTPPVDNPSIDILPPIPPVDDTATSTPPIVPPDETPTTTPPVIPDQPIKVPAVEEPVTPEIVPISRSKKSIKSLAKIGRINKKSNLRNKA